MDKYKMIGTLLGIIGLICIIISISQEGNNLFLEIGLLCNCISLLLFVLINKKKNL